MTDTTSIASTSTPTETPAAAATTAATETEEIDGTWIETQVTGLPPPPKAGHSIVEYNGALFLLGGFDGHSHFFSFDCLTLTPAADNNKKVNVSWSPVNIVAAVGGPQVGAPRALHTAVVCGDVMYVWGGSGTIPATPPSSKLMSLFVRSLGGDPQQHTTFGGAVARFNFHTRSWDEAPVIGMAPAARDGHSCVAHNGRLWIFGGSDDTQVFSDLHVFDTATSAWLPLPPPTVPTSVIPSARRLHSAVLHCRPSSTFDDAPPPAAAAAPTTTPTGEWSMIVFGGYDGRRCMNDVYKYSFTTNAWSAVTTRGTPPTARFGHSAVVRGNTMVVFGGYGAGLGYRSDCYKLDLLTWVWSKVVAASPAPQARRCHAAAMALNGSVMVAVGGSTSSAVTGNHLNDVAIFRFKQDDEDDEDSQSNGDGQQPQEGNGVLGQDLGKLLDSPNPFTDVTFIISDPLLGTATTSSTSTTPATEEEQQEMPAETKISAHRAILAARSPVFDRLFRSSFSDGASGSTVAIQDCSAVAFQALLRFLYTGSLRSPQGTVLEPDMILELIALGERYMVPTLKKLCERELLRPGVICPSNCCSILVQADQYSCVKLRQLALEYIARRFNTVKTEAEFGSLPQPLLLQIMSEMAKLSQP